MDPRIDVFLLFFLIADDLLHQFLVLSDQLIDVGFDPFFFRRACSLQVVLQQAVSRLGGDFLPKTPLR